MKHTGKLVKGMVSQEPVADVSHPVKAVKQTAGKLEETPKEAKPTDQKAK